MNIDNAPRKFDRAMYLYPIQFSEISNSRKLVQNPGW
ncbi:RagB/SusD family nutrient uptake outer membrane protein [Flavobacterium ranwuense]